MSLDGILHDSAIPYAYRLAYILNFFREPLLKDVEAEFGLTRPEWTVLLCLSYQDGLISRDICAFTGQPRNSISRGVALLSEKGLVRRAADAADGRRNVITITEAGRAVFDRIMPHFQAREREMIACLEPEELRALDGLLSKLAAHVPEWGPKNPIRDARAAADASSVETEG